MREDAFECFITLFNECSLDSEYVFEIEGVPTQSDIAWINQMGNESSMWNMFYFQMKNLKRYCLTVCEDFEISHEVGNVIYLLIVGNTSSNLQDLVDE